MPPTLKNSPTPLLSAAPKPRWLHLFWRDACETPPLYALFIRPSSLSFPLPSTSFYNFFFTFFSFYPLVWTFLFFILSVLFLHPLFCLVSTRCRYFSSTRILDVDIGVIAYFVLDRYSPYKKGTIRKQSDGCHYQTLVLPFCYFRI